MRGWEKRKPAIDSIRANMLKNWRKIVKNEKK